MLQTNFIQRTKELLKEEYNAFEKALYSSPPISIRINPRKFPVDTTETVSPLGDESSSKENIYPCENGYNFSFYNSVPWCNTGRYLLKRPSFTFDPLFHAGVYYVQEAASMFLEQAVKKIITDDGQKPVTVLDLCAAPGGKSTLLQALLPTDSLLVCNDVIRSRSMILAENIAKWGNPDNIVTNNDPKDLGQHTDLFDIILADLPCSGEGMFRKDPVSRNEWSIENVKLCASRQRRIIYDVWNALKPGGWLIYSTCTFNTEENEENVFTLAGELGAEIVSIPTDNKWNIAGSRRYDKPVYRFFPHRVQGEGFFLALMRKNDRPVELKKIYAKNKNNAQPIKIPAFIINVLSEPERFIFHTSKKNNYEKKIPTKNAQETTTINAIPKVHNDIYNLLSHHLNIISAGIFLGELKGKDFIPSTQLAMSTELRKGAFTSVELSYEQIIKFLQKEVIILPEEIPTGYILMTYKNTPLGFVKNIGNRANNIYPQEWRIRKMINDK